MNTKKLKILIADDEKGLRLSMAGILELEGYNVFTASDGYEAIELVRKESFDVAFLDIRMPGINGVETFREIKKISPETMVIMMTAYAVKDLIKEAINEGAYACINKPFDMERVVGTIKDLSQKPFIVVIDDDQDLCNLLHDRFEDHGFNVVTKTSGLEGIELVKRKIPDIMLLDVVMEGINGVDTLRRLRELLGENCPKTIMMSAYDSQKKFDEAMELGAVKCLKKPLDMDRIKALVYRVMDSGARKICIVDDDKTLCCVLKETLASNGYEVEVASGGNEVIEKIQKEVFKVMIINLNLPDGNGLEVYEKIKQKNPDVGVIFISGSTSDEGVESTFKKNNFNCLQKPFEPEHLIKMLKNITFQKRPS